MHVDKVVHCDTHPCLDVVQTRYLVPQIELDPDLPHPTYWIWASI